MKRQAPKMDLKSDQSTSGTMRKSEKEPGTLSGTNMEHLDLKKELRTHHEAEKTFSDMKETLSSFAIDKSDELSWARIKKWSCKMLGLDETKSFDSNDSLRSSIDFKSPEEIAEMDKHRREVIQFADEMPTVAEKVGHYLDFKNWTDEEKKRDSRKLRELRDGCRTDEDRVNSEIKFEREKMRIEKHLNVIVPAFEDDLHRSCCLKLISRDELGTGFEEMANLVKEMGIEQVEDRVVIRAKIEAINPVTLTAQLKLFKVGEKSFTDGLPVAVYLKKKAVEILANHKIRAVLNPKHYGFHVNSADYLMALSIYYYGNSIKSNIFEQPKSHDISIRFFVKACYVALCRGGHPPTERNLGFQRAILDRDL